MSRQREALHGRPPRQRPQERDAAEATQGRVAGHPFLKLQTSIGNQAVNKLIRGEIRLRRPDDSAEHEAHDQAEWVARVRDLFQNRRSADSLLKPVCGSAEHATALAAAGMAGERMAGHGRPGRTLDARPPDRAPSFHLATPDGPIRVFDDAAAHGLARQLGAHAFTWQSDVFLGATLDQPFAPSRSMALSHERIHAQQMRRRGPWAPESALESEAESGTDRPHRGAPPD